MHELQSCPGYLSETNGSCEGWGMNIEEKSVVKRH